MYWAKQGNNKPPQKQIVCIEIKQILSKEIMKIVTALVYKLHVHLTYIPTGLVQS